jgi:flagellar hook-basal body complex protein FliE
LSTLELLTGNTDDLANTMISAQKSELAVNLTVAIRNKAIEAYKEIMNMQV